MTRTRPRLAQNIFTRGRLGRVSALRHFRATQPPAPSAARKITRFVQPETLWHAAYPPVWMADPRTREADMRRCGMGRASSEGGWAHG